MTGDGGAPRYRIGFLQTVMLGNMNRYRLLRTEVETDSTVDARWIPLRSWVDGDWLRILPGWFRIRVRHLLDSARLFAARRLDAVVVHAPEMYGIYGSFHGLLRLRSVLVENSDAPTTPHGTVGRILLDRAQRRTDLFVPWSTHVADAIKRTCPDAATRLHVLHPGLPIDRWPLRDPPDRSDRDTTGTHRFRLLFVGGDVIRKGLDTALDAIEAGLGDSCDFDIVTQSRNLPETILRRVESLPQARLHLDLEPASAELQSLFQRADVLLLPTRYDLSPWVILEALATGVPVIASDIGGISDMIIDGRTGLLISPDDPAGLAAAVKRLRDTPPAEIDELVRNGREHVERHFDARANTEAMLGWIKAAVDERRRAAAT